jgi:hypothetical protein
MLKILKDLSNEFEEQQRKFMEMAQKQIEPVLKNFMKEHPNIKAIGWQQYTPYFNDGDECVFRYNGLFASNVEDFSDSFYGDGWFEVYGTVEEGYDPKDWADLRELDETLSSLENCLQVVFGDHVRVIVTQKGVDVEECEHD